DSKFFPKELTNDEYSLIQVATVNSVSFLKAYKPNLCLLEKNKEFTKIDVLVVFCDIKLHECLLNVKMLI
ncbi:MAG: hypothetical protein WC006_09540, partial [Bacilli bacterium]